MKKINFFLMIVLSGLIIFSGCNKESSIVPESELNDEVLNIKEKNSRIGGVYDACGNFYHTVRIGTQVWLAENLRAECYSNGDPIEYITDNAEWYNTSSGAYCYYNNDPFYQERFGHMYNAHTVNDPRGIAPDGFHVASKEDWEILINFAGGMTNAGGKLKALWSWMEPNEGATDQYGFSGLGGGMRTNFGNFYFMKQYTIFWTSTIDESGNNWGTSLHYLSDNCPIAPHLNYQGFYIRCVADNPAPPPVQLPF